MKELSESLIRATLALLLVINGYNKGSILLIGPGVSGLLFNR